MSSNREFRATSGADGKPAFPHSQTQGPPPPPARPLADHTLPPILWRPARRRGAKGNLPNCRSYCCEKQSMISIQSSLAELERSHQIRAEVLDCYVLAIRNIAHYAVELDGDITRSHRKYLDTLAAEVAMGTSEALADSRANLRGLLRDF